CNATDLCADGWHVCHDLGDVRASSPTQLCDDTVEGFWVTSQTQNLTGGCILMAISENNLVGCGTVGLAADATCQPLTRAMHYDTCAATGIWQCGDALQGSHEAALVTKNGPGGGGVLCCKG